MALFIDGGDRSHGQYWNIFFILVTAITVGLFIPNFLLMYSYWIALGIMVLYQVGLSNGLQDYARQHNSGSFLHANVRGFLQSIGYFSCYLIGLGVGRRLYSIDYSQPNPAKKVLLEFLILLVGAGAAFLISFFFVAPSSPGTCNFTYVSYIVVNGCYYCLIVLLYERTLKQMWPTMILEGPTRTSRLIYFIVANLLTGLINKIVDLGQVSVVIQLAVATIYMSLLHGLFCFFVIKKIPVRFW